VFYILWYGKSIVYYFISGDTCHEYVVAFQDCQIEITDFVYCFFVIKIIYVFKLLNFVHLCVCVCVRVCVWVCRHTRT
jgi:hypothetical protein